ncbi:hypothetical protein RO3G_12599 [Rhizopus delemar RA 99-880]|uniref:Uncharacterized protein n=1 Tax=Rhizopus delemar (strain RA 99-880 / ATCC MYA-4621 / FGSC 9543 / NRRL 43880) TaxID=246409 RepID=I1CHF8_RHIO9|nr:hypothetical protein RO3G_12599 [Rhizopus delemar RA 99-880]|eukprot:EIE87888.1 hypothetical protein RO3G_12599 [Rhizopus delemar RA 99-880]
MPSQVGNSGKSNAAELDALQKQLGRMNGLSDKLVIN